MHWTIPVEHPNCRAGRAMRRGLRWWLVISLAVKLLIVVGAAIQRRSCAGTEFEPVSPRSCRSRDQDPLRLSSSSWLFQKSDPPTQVRLHDLITIVVNEKSAVTSTGQLDRRKTGKFDAELKNWIHLEHRGRSSRRR